ncbi:MAG: hypothetical protein LBT47_06285 [Deltaproteobacteria bacterium]|jgi:hypothetical protein|nr:hypothetical protein [Deltaproteobacteria bacterium]
MNLKPKQIFLYALCIISISMVYILSSRNVQYGYEFYVQLTKSFFKGHTYLALAPGLESLPDPYDPEANHEFRRGKTSYFHDSSYYNGKIYIYYGPTPVLTFFLPAYFLSIQVYDRHAALFYLLGAFLFQALLFLKLTARPTDLNLNQPDPRTWFTLAGLWILGLTSPGLTMLKRPDIYEVAMTSSLFFISGALYFLTLRLFFVKKNWLIVLISLFLVLGVGSRITAVIPSALFFLIIIYILYKEKATIRPYIYLFLPFTLGMISYLLYNHARFDSFFEFGINYIISEFTPSSVVAGFSDDIKIIYFFKILKVYLFNFFTFSHIFPFVSLNIAPIENIIVYEIAIPGLLSCFPVKWSLILLPWVCCYWRKIGRTRLALFTLLLVLGALLILGALAQVPMIFYHYLPNISLFLTLAALLVWGFLLGHLWYQDSDRPHICIKHHALLKNTFYITILISFYFSYVAYFYAFYGWYVNDLYHRGIV